MYLHTCFTYIYDLVICWIQNKADIFQWSVWVETTEPDDLLQHDRSHDLRGEVSVASANGWECDGRQFLVVDLQ